MWIFLKAFILSRLSKILQPGTWRDIEFLRNKNNTVRNALYIEKIILRLHIYVCIYLHRRARAHTSLNG